ncbi:MAG: MASE1 domain-containing protein [Alphaproteobacteria bacterium]
MAAPADISTPVVHHGAPAKEAAVDAAISKAPDPSKIVRTAIAFLGVAVAYFLVAKLGLALASINPSATPVWPPTGLALAALLLGGYRLSGAVFIAAFLANQTTAGSLFTSSAIAFGNTLEALIGAYLVNQYARGRRVFESPGGVVRFTLISLLISTPVSATIGVASLNAAGFVDANDIRSVWMTWWRGDFAGALVVTPVIVLWAESIAKPVHADEWRRSIGALAGAAAVGLLAFSPLLEESVSGAPGFLAVLPLMWAALRCGPRETASVILILSLFAIWGTASHAGPFARDDQNEALLLLVMFMVSMSVPSLILSADAATRRRVEADLRRTQTKLKTMVRQRTASLEQTQEALHQAQKMDALGQLTGGIAHDFNNVLTAIIANIDRARSGKNPRSQISNLDAALAAANNGAALIRQMLVFARKQPLAMKPIDVAALMEGTATLLRSSCPETIRIEVVCEPDLKPALADPHQLETCLLNLALNARDAMPQGGTMKLSVSKATAAPGAPERLSIAVSDTGTGMTEDVLNRAMEPFFTTKEIGKGTGLGLSMVYGAVRQMGGEVSIESVLGKGTVVRMLVPSCEAPAAPVRAAPVDEPRTHARGVLPGLLYVEDDALVALATEPALTEAGFRVHMAANAERALDILARHPEIGVVVTDIGLPGMSGHELVATARRDRPDLKALLVTGYDRAGTIGASEPPPPGTGYLDKPYDTDELVRRVFQLLS